MKVMLVTVCISLTFLFSCLDLALAQDISTCRQRNLQSMIDRMGALKNPTPQQAALLSSLKHQLQVSRAFKEGQVAAQAPSQAAQAPPQEFEDSEPAAECLECIQQE